MRFACYFSLLLFLATSGARAQQVDTGQSTLSVRSTVVQVPALAKTKEGEVIFNLSADDFLLTDDGVPQQLTLDQDTDSQPLALAIVVETGGAGARHLSDYHLDTILDALIGDVKHRVAVIGFDSAPHLLVPFSPDTADAFHLLAALHEGDSGGATLDAIAFALAQLRTQPAGYRRAILLLSETIDQGSKTTLNDALRLITEAHTTVYSFGFSSTRSAVTHETSKLKSGEPGPPHGCFSRDGADTEYEGHYSKQVLDCVSQLAPPLRLATMAFITAHNSLRANTAESIAQLTGGEFFRFHNAKDLKEGLIAASNDVPNYYVLSFRPTSPTPGLHALHLEIKNLPKVVLKFRSEYWIDSDAAP
ncbi:MAG: VWA domain-containing protein [Terriglobales bacterium]|jgi:VWFA-related protein|nr:VWA domain-containing protein [Terriglobales bacterium]